MYLVLILNLNRAGPRRGGLGPSPAKVNQEGIYVQKGFGSTGRLGNCGEGSPQGSRACQGLSGQSDPLSRLLCWGGGLLRRGLSGGDRGRRGPGTKILLHLPGQRREGPPGPGPEGGLGLRGR